MEQNRDDEDEEETPEVRDAAEEDELPRGWKPSEETIGAIREPKETPKSPQDSPVQGDANDVKNLTSAFEQLEATEAGQPIARAIREHDTTIRFGALDNSTTAQFDPNKNEITINENQKDASSAALAAHLAHEGVHVGWDQPYRLSSFEEFAEDYIEEEYQAFKAQDEMWRAAKGEETDERCDTVSAMMDRGESEAKDMLLRSYFDDILRSWSTIN